jgi:hypothetical protein
MTALDWAAKIVEENGRELAESFLSAARRGDWRAADALMNRIYGKPEAALVAHVPPSSTIDVIRAMSLDEKLELLGRLREGEPVSTAPAPPTIEAVPPVGLGLPPLRTRLCSRSPRLWAQALGARLDGCRRGRERSRNRRGLSRRRPEGDWRAAEALMNRIYGKPEPAIVAHIPPNPALPVLKSMSLEEKLEFLHSLQRGEVLDHPVIEGGSRSSTTGNELGP